MYSSVKQRYEKPTAGYTQQLSYLKVPLLFTYNADPSNRVVFTAKVGPQVNMLLKSKISNATEAVKNGNTDDNYKDFVFGATAGAGARVRIAGNMHLTAGLKFDGSFGNIENKNAKGYQAGRAKTYDLNSGVEVGMKYFF
jgi:hypothetical protein